MATDVTPTIRVGFTSISLPFLFGRKEKDEGGGRSSHGIWRDRMTISSSEGRRDQVHIQVKNLDRNYPHQPATRSEFQSSSLKQKRDPNSILAAPRSFGRFVASPIIEDQRSTTFSQEAAGLKGGDQERVDPYPHSQQQWNSHRKGPYLPTFNPHIHQRSSGNLQVSHLRAHEEMKRQSLQPPREGPTNSQLFESMEALSNILENVRSISVDIAQLKVEIESSPPPPPHLPGKGRAGGRKNSVSDLEQLNHHYHVNKDQISNPQLKSSAMNPSRRSHDHFIEQLEIKSTPALFATINFSKCYQPRGEKTQLHFIKQVVRNMTACKENAKWGLTRRLCTLSEDVRPSPKPPPKQPPQPLHNSPPKPTKIHLWQILKQVVSETTLQQHNHQKSKRKAIPRKRTQALKSLKTSPFKRRLRTRGGAPTVASPLLKKKKSSTNLVGSILLFGEDISGLQLRDAVDFGHDGLMRAQLEFRPIS